MGKAVCLTQEQKRELVELYDTGEYTYESIAKKFGIVRSTAWKIVTKAKDEERERNKQAFEEELNTKTKEFSMQRRKVTTKLIEAMADYAIVYNLEDTEIVERLFKCGLTMVDFVLCGYGEFARDCLGLND